MTFRNGLASLLRPEDSVLVLIDHQPYQLANLNSHEPQMVINNSTALAKAAKAFGVPTILTSVVAERGGLIFPQITDVFPGQEVIDRTFINTWEDKNVVDAVNAARTQLLDIRTLDWSNDMLALFGVPRAVLPTVVPNRHAYGRVMFGDRYVPLVVCTGDPRAFGDAPDGVAAVLQKPIGLATLLAAIRRWGT